MHHAMQQASTARAFLRRIHPWLGRSVHRTWKQQRRSWYQSEADALLMALSGRRGPLPPDLALRVQGFVGRLYREFFPPDWKNIKHPTYAEVLREFRWWLDTAEKWSEPKARPTRVRTAKPVGPRANQPRELLKLLRLPHPCGAAQFTKAWRRFLKTNHPDLNPDQSPEERRRFAEAVALWRR
jgi:hypothetical protein